MKETTYSNCDKIPKKIKIEESCCLAGANGCYVGTVHLGEFTMHDWNWVGKADWPSHYHNWVECYYFRVFYLI